MFIPASSASSMCSDDDLQQQKRARLNLEDINNQNHSFNQSLVLLSLPIELLEHALSSLDACDLLAVAGTSRYLSLVAIKVARNACMARAQWDERVASRWRAANWIERLHIEESAATFDMARCERSGFQFINGHARLLRDSIRRADVSESVSMGGVLDEVDGPSEPWPEEGLVPELAFSPTDQFLTAVTLEGIGPKLLVSEYSTAQKPVLRWRLELRGNNAVEFGVCPASLQDQPKALHKCFECQNGVRPSGFCSAITVGSLLPVKLPLMRGSVVEILLSKSRLSYIVTNPPNGTEMTWHNAVTVPKPYKGPREFRFETDLDSGEVPMKLAITCWARAQFDVLHHHLPYDSGELDVGHEIQVQEHQEYAV